MPIVNGRYVSPTWLNNAPPAIDQNELQAITDTLEELDSGTGGGESGKRYASLVIGTSTNGWTTEDCDYLCDGTADDVEFNAAIDALPESGGEIKILSGNYNISQSISWNSAADFSVTMVGSGYDTVLTFPSAKTTPLITIYANTRLTVKNLSFVNCAGIGPTGQSYFSSYNCTYTNSYFKQLGGHFLFIGNTFYITENLPSTVNYIIYAVGMPVSGSAQISNNSFYVESEIDYPNYIFGSAVAVIFSSNTIISQSALSVSGGNEAVFVSNYISGANLSCGFNGLISGNCVINGNISGAQATINGNSVTNGSISGREGTSIYGNNVYQETPVGNACIYLYKGRTNESATAFNCVSGNTCNGGTIGILLQSSSFPNPNVSNAVVTGNTCSSSNPMEISSNWSNCLITGNMFPNGTITDNGSGNTKTNNITSA